MQHFQGQICIGLESCNPNNNNNSNKQNKTKQDKNIQKITINMILFAKVEVSMMSLFLDAEKETETDAAPPPKLVDPVAATNKVVGGKYVPPGKRGEASSGQSGMTSSSRSALKNKTAPQINSQHEFPSLAASSDIAKHTWVMRCYRPCFQFLISSEHQ